MEKRRPILNDSTKSCILIPAFILLCIIAIFYSYCFVIEHEILSIKQNASFENDKFTITAICRPVDAFTSAPYVSIKLNDFEVVTTAVNAGYDFTSDCLQSSIKDVQLIEDERKVKIYMKDGQIKEIPIIYNSNNS